MIIDICFDQHGPLQTNDDSLLAYNYKPGWKWRAIVLSRVWIIQYRESNAGYQYMFYNYVSIVFFCAGFPSALTNLGLYLGKQKIAHPFMS